MGGRILSVAFAVALVVGGCASAAAPSSSALDVPTVPASVAATPAASELVPQASPPAIVGEWVGIHDCLRIQKMLSDAGLEEFVAEAVYGNGLVPGVAAESDIEDMNRPCAAAVPRKHSHFFTADGFFGSKDYDGAQVDDGGYRLEGDDVVVINGTSFRYRIDGDELTLVPPEIDISDCTTKECRFPAAWVLMVAMPGTTWTRGTIAG